MTSLMNWVRRADVRRGTSGIAAAALLCAVAGCQDQASNTGDTQPIAVTESGIEILEVVRDENKRTVEAVVVAGGEERQVTLAPAIDGPLPSGVKVTVNPRAGEDPTTLTYSWDTSSGATWFRQQAGTQHFELTREVTSSRIAEEYVFNDRTIRLEYANLAPRVLDNAVEKFLAGEPLAELDSESLEFVGQLQTFDAFASQLPSGSVLENQDARMLSSLLIDPAFIGVVMGEDAQRYLATARADAACSFFNICMAISCRFIINVQVCGVCAAGSLACAFLDFLCFAWCGD